MENCTFLCPLDTQEQGRHAVSEIRRAVSMEVAVKESKRVNTAEMRKRLKRRRRVLIPPCSKDLYEWSLPKHVKHTPYMGG